MLNPTQIKSIITTGEGYNAEFPSSRANKQFKLYIQRRYGFSLSNRKTKTIFNQYNYLKLKM